MKKRINIFSNNIIKNFLNTLFSNYELMFIKLEDIDYNAQNTQANIIFISGNEDLGLINFKNLSDNYLIAKSAINFYFRGLPYSKGKY